MEYEMPEPFLMKRCRGTQGIFSLLIFAWVLLVDLNPAIAHRAMIFAWVEGDTVYTESKFSGGRRVKGGGIHVYDLDGNQLLSGKTNHEGEFSFKKPQKKGVKVVLLAGPGHRGEWTLLLEESQETPSGESDALTEKENAAIEGGNKDRMTQEAGLSADEIENAVEKVLEKKLRPVIKMLAESREQGPSVTEVLGGIGYILGLMGVAVYFSYRRRSGGTKNKEGNNQTE
jgi:nickel transport protein